MLGDFTKTQVTVRKIELLAAIKHNRIEHKAEFEEAFEKYLAKVVEELEEKLVQAKSGKGVDALETQAPVNHLADYDRTIRMLEMSTADEITVTQQQFEQYVLDEWNWKYEFAALNSTYTLKGKL